MRRAYNDKSALAVMIIIIGVILTSYIGFKAALWLQSDKATDDVQTKLNYTETVSYDTASKAVEVVSAKENEEMDKPDSSVNASKQSSLEKAIEDLMIKTETE